MLEGEHQLEVEVLTGSIHQRALKSSQEREATPDLEPEPEDVPDAERCEFKLQ